MRTVRRLYFYAVSLISLELALWGAVGLLRNIFNVVPGSSAPLASGLALVLAGLPIFLLHWTLAQREAYRDDDERSSLVRALFLYGTLLGVLVPVVQSTMAILNRLFLGGLGLDPLRALVGGNQSSVDNLIAIAANLVVCVYFIRELQRDWQANLPGSSLTGVRRLYRYVWVLYGLILAAAGVRLVLYFMLYVPVAYSRLVGATLANGLALVVAGAPLWVWTWQRVQNSLEELQERRSLLRLVILYLVTLTSVITTLITTGVLLADLLRRWLGANPSLTPFLQAQASSLATLIPAGVIWAYYWRHLRLDLANVPDEPRRAGLGRLYYSILSLGGTAATFSGAQQVLSYVVQVLLGTSVGIQGLRGQLASALAALIVGLPLWLSTWLRMQAEAAGTDDSGDHARRSTVRKGYLYLVLFITVVGAMGSAGWLLYLIFRNLLGQRAPGFAVDAANWAQTLVLVLIWLVYHLQALRADGSLAQRSLGNRHAVYPVLIFQDNNEGFTMELVQALQRLAPRIPIIVHRSDQGAPGEDLLSARAVVLPAWLAMQPGEALRLWLKEFKGQRLLVPLPTPGWIWLGSAARDDRDMARETAQSVRQLAEGQEVRPSTPSNPWAVVGYVLGAVFGLLLLILIFGAVVNGFG